MGLQDLDQQLDEVRAKATKLSDVWNRDVQEIDADTSLSDEGKRITREQRFATRRAQMDSHREEEHALVDRRIDDLERKLDSYVGYASSDIIAFRDAQDRAERVEKDQAGTMLERAIRTSDRTLAHALYRRALDAGWGDVQKLFSAKYPDAAEAATDLQTLRRFKENSMERTMAYYLQRA